MKTLAVSRNLDQAKTILIEHCERREIGPYSDTDTALSIDLTDSLTFNLYWRYRKPEAWDKLQIGEVIPSDCYICDEHAVLSFEDAGNGTTLIKIYKAVEMSRKFVRNLFAFLIMPLIVIGLNWEFSTSLYPFHSSAIPQLIVWIAVLIFLE